MTTITIDLPGSRSDGSLASGRSAEREALARLIDPEAWKEKEPIPDAFASPETQEVYEGFFWDAVRERREPSLAAADRVLGFRRTVHDEPSDAVCVDIANRAQAETGRLVWPSTVRAILRAAAEVEGGAR